MNDTTVDQTVFRQHVPSDRRALTINDLVCIAYEERSLDPTVVDDIGIDEPLRSWLSARQLER